MSVRLSHTAKEMYLRSPRSYFYHYYMNLRPEKTNSALFFGSIIETGLDSLLQGKSLIDSIAAFKDNFKTIKLNGYIENLESSSNIKYSKADFDRDLFNEQELILLGNESDNYKAWSSLQKKGELLLEAYSLEILPKIKKVIATQVKISGKNEVGDEIVGFADLICEWEDGRILVLDHKTSSIKYPSDAVQSDQYGKQTALYYDKLKDQYNLSGAGFIVLEKNIRKKQPRARVYFTNFEEPNELLIQKTFDEFDEVCHNIKNGKFDCFSPNCDVYGQSCPYKKYCCSNGEDMTGLVKIDNKKA